MRFVSVLVLVALAGCGTLFNGGPDRVQVMSNPPGARVFVDNQEVGVTPMTVTLDRARSQGNIRVEAPGFQPAATQRVKTFNTVAILNCANLIFWVIDIVTGNHQQFDTTPVGVNLVPGQGGYPTAPGAYPQQPGVAPIAPPPAGGYAPPAPIPPPAQPAPVRPGM